jgi:hypothetical protein
MKVSTNDIDIVNRWEAKEKAKGRKVGGPLKMQCADFEQLIKPFQRYGKAM